MSGEDDLLERATRALRAAPPPSEEELRIERALLMRAQRARMQKQRSKSRTLRWVLPLAAVLTAGSALAATSGQIERVVQALSTWIEQPRAGAPAAKKRSSSARPRPTPQALPVPAEPPASEPAPTEPAASPTPSLPNAANQRPQAARPADALASEARRSRRARAPETSAEASANGAGEGRSLATADAGDVASAEPAVAGDRQGPDADLMRYREAHRLHFRERDYWAALRAWESYLRTYPEGTFAIEARYNRAICLVRLGRKDEARRALAPFAHGEVGAGYRKTEASELLEALE